jgi:predicted Zn-dependent peptidase
MAYQKTVLPNGARVVTEKVANVHSVSLGVCITRGSRDESEKENGLSHFIEHLLFKGTNSRSAKDIAVEIDGIGGELNGYTSREFTYFYARFLDEDLPKAWDLLSDILKNSLFDSKEMEIERNVILEEIKSFNDSPSEQSLSLLTGCLFEPHPLSYSILGPEENVKRFSRADISDFCARHYHGGNLIIGATGNIDHKSVVDLVSSLRYPRCEEEREVREFPPTSAKSKDLEKNDISQVHVALGSRIAGYGSELRYPWLLLNTLLGGSMSSRLFQRLREKEGLAYEVGSFLELYSEVGIFAAYVVMDPKNVSSAIDCVWEEFDNLAKNGLEPGELERTKSHLKGSLLLSLESTTARMIRLLSNEMRLRRYVSLDESIENLEKVSEDTVLSVAQSCLVRDMFSVARVGPSTAK